MKANSDKFQFIIIGNISSHILQVGDITSKSVTSVTLLGITIGSKLSFKEHISDIIKKTYYNLHALRRLRKFIT